MSEIISQQHLRIIEAFDQDETAGSFLREDGEGGFASGVYRMAREIERLREENARLTQSETLQQAVNRLVRASHDAAIDAGWWNDLHTGESLIGKRNVGEMLMLAVSELAEAMEGHRKGLQDDKLPHRPMLEVEIADCLIRLGDLAGSMGFDLGGAVAEKLAYNARRADHRPENRREEGGKAY